MWLVQDIIIKENWQSCLKSIQMLIWLHLASINNGKKNHYGLRKANLNQ